jgi:hypothetical protein
MAWKPKTTFDSEYELIPAGNHEAYCYGLVDLGTHPRPDYLGKKKDPAQKIRLYFEFTELRKVFKEENGEEPSIKYVDFNFVFGDNSNLTKVLKPWIGNPETFDLEKLIGMPCMVKIEHEPGKKDPSKIYDNITAITEMSDKLKKLMPKRHNKDMIFNIDEHGFESKQYEKLYPGAKKKIVESLEYKEYESGPASEEPLFDSAPDDIPFE